MNCSIILCSFNRVSLLRETLESLLLHLRKSDPVEILVIDNNSIDGTAVMAQAYAQDYSHIKYFRETNQGLSYARNRGAREAKGDLLIFLDDDVEINADWFNEIIKPFIADPKIGVVGGKVLPFECDIPVWLPSAYHFLASVFDPGNEGEYVEDVMGANFAVRRSVLAQSGLFNVALGRKGKLLLAGEENELFTRIKALGFKVYFAPQCIVLHKISEKLNKTYILDYARNLGISSAAFESQYEKYKFYMKSLASMLFIPAFFILSLARREQNNSLGPEIKFEYYCGYISRKLKLSINQERLG